MCYNYVGRKGAYGSINVTKRAQIASATLQKADRATGMY
jgi:hypothetical protein